MYGGSLTVEAHPHEFVVNAFYKFLDGMRMVKRLSQGTYGVTYTMASETSPYENPETGARVDEVLVKVTFLRDRREKVNIGGKTVQTVPDREFEKEVRMMRAAQLSVRRALSASHVPVAVALGPSGAAEAVLPLALSVLEREEPEVLLPLLGALPHLLTLLAPLDAAGASSHVPAAPGCPSGYALGSQLLPLLLNLEMPITARSASWRGSLTLLEQFGALTAYLEPGTLYSLVLPMLFGRLTTEAAAPVRLQAARVICMQLRRLRTATQRSEVCSRLVSQLGCAEAFTLRLLFTSVCGMLLEPRCPYGCSRAFFKAHHLHTALLNLASDPVPNVRLRVCELLPTPSRPWCRLPCPATNPSSL